MTDILTPPDAEIDTDTLRAEVAAFCEHNWDPDMAVKQWWQLLAGSG